MRASKYTLVVSWLMVTISVGAIMIIQKEIDIRIQEAITQTKWIYDFESRAFFKSIWGNVFTGAIVALATTYVAYFREKHDIEFELKMSEIMLTLKFGLLASPMYSIDLKNPQNNHAAIARFANQIVETREQYNRMVIAHNEYCPFFKTKKVKVLLNGKILLQKIWQSICGVEDDLIVYENDRAIKDGIDETRKATDIWHEQLKELYEALNK